MNTLALRGQNLDFKGLTSQLSVLEDFELDLGNSHNDPLPDDVQQLIQKQLSDAEHHLASLDATGIPSVANSLGGSCIYTPNFKYSDLARRIQSYRVAIAPHRKLPNEVLIEIFLCSPPAHITTPTHSPESGPHAKPYNLMHVCSKWRQLAFHLWRDVFVLYKNKEDLKRNAALIEDVILRCGGLPISLIISVFDDHELRPNDVEKGISDLVIKVAGSFRDFTWVGNSKILINSLKFRPDSVELVGNVFKDAYSLRTFTVVARFNMFDHCAISPSFLIRPWNHFTHLTFAITNSIGSGEFLHLLYQCTNLLEFRGSIGPRTYFTRTALFPSPSAVPILPNLKLLWITCPSSDVIPYLNLPNLTSFKLFDFNVYSAPEWNTRVLPFFVRSNRLTHLTLKPPYGYQCIPNSTFHSYLRELPLLVNLCTWYGEPFGEPTLESMARGELVPMLETLECRVPRPWSQANLSPFWRMLEQRRHEGETHGFAPIRNVVIAAVCKYRETLGSLEALGRLRARGVRIDIRVIRDLNCVNCSCVA